MERAGRRGVPGNPPGPVGILLFLGSLMLSVVACGGPAPEPEGETPEARTGETGTAAAPSGPVAYESRVLEHGSPGCSEGATVEADEVDEDAVVPPPPPCAEVRLSWPEITAAPSPEAAERIRSWVMSTLLMAPMGEETSVDSPEAFAEQFVSGFEDFRAEFPDFPAGWADEREIDVIYQDSGVVSLRFSEYVYTGGAHPNSAVTLASFDPDSGRPLRLEELFVDGFEARLRQAAERRFREARGLAPDESLDEAGFWFEDGFTLNDNWAVDGPGLLFHWDPYEVAPYALGHTEIVLPLEDLQGIVDSAGPLAR